MFWEVVAVRHAVIKQMNLPNKNYGRRDVHVDEATIRVAFNCPVTARRYVDSLDDYYYRDGYVRFVLEECA